MVNEHEIIRHQEEVDDEYLELTSLLEQAQEDFEENSLNLMSEEDFNYLFFNEKY